MIEKLFKLHYKNNCLPFLLDSFRFFYFRF